MPKVMMYKADGTQAGEIALADEVFAAPVNENALHEVVVAHLAAVRHGTQSALTRTEVRGGGIKPWRQKGTGRARQGSTRAPQWTKGGVVFAPKPRSYRVKVNKKVKRLAMLSALTVKVQEENLIVLDELVMDAPKTKDIVAMLAALKVEGKALLVTADKDANVVKAANNIPGVDTAFTGCMSVYDILNHGKLIVTEAAVRKVEEVYA